MLPSAFSEPRTAHETSILSLLKLINQQFGSSSKSLVCLYKGDKKNNMNAGAQNINLLSWQQEGAVRTKSSLLTRWRWVQTAVFGLLKSPLTSDQLLSSAFVQQSSTCITECISIDISAVPVVTYFKPH